MKVVGLIPARRGSKRVKGKNMAILGGKPLLQWTIEGAKIASNHYGGNERIINRIVVSTDWDECGSLAMFSGCSLLMRPPELCQDTSHDYEWVKHALDRYPGYDIFAILRPTSPFRTAETIKRAMKEFLDGPPCDSMRAIERSRAHPKKSWEIMESGSMYPYEEGEINGFPYFDLPTQSLGDVYVQNGCIHIAWTATLEKYGNVSGDVIRHFFTEGRESVDINTPEDLQYAEWLIGRKK